jgi:hypothetical protein
MDPRTCTLDQFWELTAKLANEMQDSHFDLKLLDSNKQFAGPTKGI